MEFIDYYKILELDKSAKEADIKKAFRKLARKYHPDLNPKDELAKKKFQEINEANEVLSDPEKRKKYDKYGKDWKHAEEFEKANQGRKNTQAGFGNADFGSSSSEHDFSDFFGSMFGEQFSGGKRGKAKYRGGDINAELHLDLKDVYEKHPQTINVTGQSIRINIPAGVENGQTIKIAGHGSPGANDGPNGDLYITFSIANNTQFKREGSNLFSNVKVDLVTAVLGGEITVDTFDGKVKLKVNPETQNGTKVKLKGKGFPVYKKEGEFGDLYITYQVLIPTHLSEKEKEIFRQLSNIGKNGN